MSIKAECCLLILQTNFTLVARFVYGVIDWLLKTTATFPTHLLNFSFSLRDFFFLLQLSNAFPDTSAFTSFHCAVFRFICLRIWVPFFLYLLLNLPFLLPSFFHLSFLFTVSLFYLLCIFNSEVQFLFSIYLILLSHHILSSCTTFLHTSSCNSKYNEKSDSDSVHLYITFFKKLVYKAPNICCACHNTE